ncbi:MAG: hypothetical protein R3D53_14130 [Paracoccaceae bacterium]
MGEGLRLFGDRGHQAGMAMAGIIHSDPAAKSSRRPSASHSSAFLGAGGIDPRVATPRATAADLRADRSAFFVMVALAWIFHL